MEELEVWSSASFFLPFSSHLFLYHSPCPLFFSVPSLHFLFALRFPPFSPQIPKEEITLIEDVWAGGGNLGPSIEYFVSGLELGNMVFMQYKTFPDGHRGKTKVDCVRNQQSSACDCLVSLLLFERMYIRIISSAATSTLSFLSVFPSRKSRGSHVLLNLALVFALVLLSSRVSWCKGDRYGHWFGAHSLGRQRIGHFVPRCLPHCLQLPCEQRWPVAQQSGTECPSFFCSSSLWEPIWLLRASVLISLLYCVPLRCDQIGLS